MDKADILHKNFEGYETSTDEEIDLIAEADLELKTQNAKSLEDVFEDLE